MNTIVILTGVSASGKSCLQKELIDRGWNTPLNFTTRKPRDDKEKDEYVFLNRTQYYTKLRNGDFLEDTRSYGEGYGISNILPEGDIVLVLDPAGREQVKKELANSEYEIKTFFLELSKEMQTNRLNKRGDSKESIEKRADDFVVYTPSTDCILLDGLVDTSVLADRIERIC